MDPQLQQSIKPPSEQDRKPNMIKVKKKELFNKSQLMQKHGPYKHIREIPYIDDAVEKLLKTEKNFTQLFPTMHKEKNYSSKTPLKKILLWNEYVRKPDFYFGFGQEAFLAGNCPVNTCFTFHDRNMLPYTDWDAVIWNYWSSDKSLPKQRSPHTRYVFHLKEAPGRSTVGSAVKRYNGIFNWTMVNRWDSDIPNPYGLVYKRRNITQAPYVNYASNKTKMAAWFVSNCHGTSGRNKLTENLQKYFQVDVYGKCGPFKCFPKMGDSCYQILDNYKFYFSFENTLCRGYITEKLFRVLKYNVIPVVYGFVNNSIKVPPHSYIDALDFPNVKALADYLKYLDSNDTAYNEYFAWKREHVVLDVLSWSCRSQFWCKLCELLHKDNKPKVYTDFYKWYVTESYCMNQNSPIISKFLNE